MRAANFTVASMHGEVRLINSLENLFQCWYFFSNRCLNPSVMPLWHLSVQQKRESWSPLICGREVLMSRKFLWSSIMIFQTIVSFTFIVLAGMQHFLISLLEELFFCFSDSYLSPFVMFFDFRSGRFGRKGVAINFVKSDDIRILRFEITREWELFYCFLIFGFTEISNNSTALKSMKCPWTSQISSNQMSHKSQ